MRDSINRNKSDKDAETVRSWINDCFGLSVDSIQPTSNHKSPDLVIKLENLKILVEVERKTEDQQFRDLLDSERGSTLKYSNTTILERIKHARRQIKDYPYKNQSDATLVWLIAGHRDSTILTGGAAINSIYGIETLEGYTEKDEYYSKPCYFFYESIFFRYKDLDAVVVNSWNKLYLCLNPYSSRIELWKGFSFLNAFSVIDPISEEAAGSAFWADCDEDRSNVNNIVRYLRHKYQLRKPTINKFFLTNMPPEGQ